jgi:hypothetical protein
VLFLGTAVPVLVHVANTAGTSNDRPANAGHSEIAQGGAKGTTNGDNGGSEADSPPDSAPKGSEADEDGTTSGSTEKPGGGPSGGAVGPSGATEAASPACTRDQLDSGGASVGAPDAAGTVYGSFRVGNVSGSDCTISGPGSVLATALGSADSSRIQVVVHTAGDAATGLPDPSTEEPQLTLAPGHAYEVRFAWVPSDSSGGCPTAGTSPDPGTGPGTSEGGDQTAQPGSEPSGEPETQPTGSILLSHVPQTGDPAAASTTVNDACAGTVYRTGVLKGS